jgi:plasmid stability protein
MNQLTLRQIPVPLEQKLRVLAKETGQSLNKTIIGILSNSLFVQSQPKRNVRDLSFLAGQWSQEEYDEFKKNTAFFDEIDPELWK